jgi:hypothetical protein
MISALLLAALLTVESGNRPNPPDGDNGQAFGPLQIHNAVVQDVNRFAGTHYTHEQTHSLSVSIAICEKYLSHYATAARLGRLPTEEDCARIWNGGPTGWKKRSTEKYWARVKAEITKSCGSFPNSKP